MDIRQSDNYAKFMESLGWIVEKAGGANIFIRKLGPTSVIKIQRPEKLDLADIDRIARKYRPLLIKIEPTKTDSSLSVSLRKCGFATDQWPLLPTKTLVLDFDSIFLDSLPKDTRYEIRKASEKSLSVSLSDDSELFYKSE